MKERPSSSERIVYCSRVDCAFTGDEVGLEGTGTALRGQHAWYECEAEIIVMDRRKIMGRTCGRFARKG